MPNHRTTPLASGTINASNRLSVELIQPVDAPAAVLIRWPAAATVADPRRYSETAANAMKILAEASTSLARIKASKRL